MKRFVYHNLISVELDCIEIFYEFISQTLSDYPLMSNVQQTCKKCHGFDLVLEQ